VGDQQWCGTDQTGLYCWGWFPDPIDPVAMIRGLSIDGPAIFASDPPISGLSTGDHHSCGLTPEGRGICWGVNKLGQLGDGTLNNTPLVVGTWPNEVWDPQLATVNTDVRFTQIAAGSTHTCAVDGNGGAHCWGDNREGQLGTAPGTECTWSDVTGPYNCRTTPAPVSGSLAFRSLSAGFGFTCGITTQGTAYCWGQNANGQLGNGGRTSVPAPAPVGGGLVFADISAGTDHACGLTTDGQLYCWGRNLKGQLGNGQTSDALMPVRVAFQVVPASLAEASTPR
jgi:alpha-tubulin suppressor-like RCC1 family protein